MAVSLVAGLISVAGAVIANTGINLFLAFAIGAGMSIVSRALMPSPDLGAQMGGRSVMTREAAHSRKIVYGRARIGGNIVYLESTGTDNKYLWLVIAVAAHEIDAYEEVWFNDEKIWDGGSFVGDWGSYVSIGFHKGDQTTSDSALTAASTKWTSDHKLLDTAYMVVKLTYDVDKFANGLPNVSTLIRGKKVLNPATSTTAWSQNPALCIYDYLLDTKYGLGESSSNILTSSVTAAATVCDETVALAAGGTQPRYTIDGVVDTAGSIKSNMDTMLGSMIGRLVFSAGKFELHAGEYVAPTYTVDESVAVGEISVQTKQSRRNAYNGVKGVFLSEDDNYILADYPAQLSSTYATQDGDPIYLDMPLPFTVNNIRAQRIAKLALFRSRQQEAITIPCNLSALRFKIGDNINVTNARLGYLNKVFEVVGYSLDFTSEGQIVVNVEAIETASSIWDWTTSDEEVYLGAGEVDIYDGMTAAAPTNLSVTGDSFLNSDGTFNAEFNVAWTDADDAFTDHYVVEWKLSSASNYYSMTTKSSPAVITSLQNGQTYNVRVKAINEIGVSSAYVASSPTAATDTTAPSVPTSVSATGQFEAVSVNWTNPTQSDFSHVDVYQSTSSGGTYTLIGKSSGTSFLSVGLSTTTTYYFKVKAVDFTGNQSAFSSVASATTVAAPASNVVTTTRMTSGTSTAAPSNAAFAAFVGRNPINGDIVYVTYTGVTPNTQKVYLRVSGSWVEQTNIISGEVITDGSVDTPEIADNAITAAKIVAGAVTAGKITVTDLAEINPDLGTVTGGDLSGVTITSTKMYQGTGTFNNANTGFYLDNSGQFSLKDKLSFNGTTLAVDGDITAVNLDVTNATVSGSFVAANLPNLQNMNGSITGSQLDSTAKFPSFFKYTRTSGTSVAAPTDTEFNTEFGRDPLENDQLIVTNTAPDPDTQAAYVRGASSWSTSANFLSGSLIVDGTVGASQIVANAVTADKINVTDLAAISADLGSITAGSLNINNAFTVTSAGVMTATSGAIGSSVTIGGTTASTVVSGAADGATALQDGDTSVDLSLNAGAVGGVTISGTTLYQGTGSFNNANTGFYLDNLGKFSLKDKLSFDGTTLDVDGDITAQNLDVTNATVTGSFVANNLPNLQNMNGNITANQITANTITVDKLSGDVSELYPTSVYANTTITSTAGFTQQFFMPAPSLSISKRQRIDMDFDFVVINSSGTDYQVEFQFGLQIKSKSATGVQVGATGGVTLSSNPFPFNWWIYISGNHLAALDNTGAVADNSSGTGNGNINSVFYHADLNRTYIMVSASSVPFSTGDTLYFNPYRFASSGTYVNPAALDNIRIHVPAGTTQTVRHNIAKTYGESTTATEFRPTIVGTTNITNVTAKLMKYNGTMENVS